MDIPLSHHFIFVRINHRAFEAGLIEVSLSLMFFVVFKGESPIQVMEKLREISGLSYFDNEMTVGIHPLIGGDLNGWVFFEISERPFLPDIKVRVRFKEVFSIINLHSGMNDTVVIEEVLSIDSHAHNISKDHAKS